MAPTQPLPQLKLIYFAVPARAEPTRIILELGGVPYEDHHLPQDQWPKYKETVPFGGIPVLEVDGKVLAQSRAIERYAARLAGLLPENPWDEAKADEVQGFLDDVHFNIAAINRRADLDQAGKAAARKAYGEGLFQDRLKQLTALLKHNGSGYLVGDKLSYVDITTYGLLSLYRSGAIEGLATDFLDHHPLVKEFHTRIASIPAIHKKYEEAQGPRVGFKPSA